ncbi:hypothetical protein [Aquimarina algiphila]|uniref:hypothetical protein n=1 Tax=Aquimarina algiphila TaxID=2047982 RepID=UPI0023305954|nr:hypothetical protein [Aquimarina algiphila]
MKKIYLSIFIGLLTVVSLNAQETVHDNNKEENTFMPKNIIKVFPLNALIGEIGIGYERVIKPKTSLNFTLIQEFRKDEIFNTALSVRDYYIFFEADMRFYLSKYKKAPEGWFVSGGLLGEYNYRKYKSRINNQGVDFEWLQIGGSGKMGYQWMFKKGLKGLTIEVAGGARYRTAVNIFDKGFSDGFTPVVDFTIGYSW